MSHLLAISVGPVQEFIAAARRTRDLWFGSYLLSEISKAVAKSVKPFGMLIFPHPDTDLEPANDKVNVANVILAELDTDDLKRIAATAKEEAQRRWRKFADEAWQAASSVIRQDIWEAQVDDVIEFYAAWVRHTEPNQYRKDRAQVMRLLAARKSCRDFLPAKGRAGIPKSSLDGQRETALNEDKRNTDRTRLRLSDGEQLDVVGIVKRVAEGNRPYPSVARVAAETWLRGIEKRGQLNPLKEACQTLVGKGLRKVREKAYDYFPYEGTIIYKDRHYDLRKELMLCVDDFNEVKAALTKILDEPRTKIGGEPSPYLAVLVADGDRMGAAISELTSADEHRGFSNKLTEFAEEARTTVAKHSGVLVYTGGDDVLAFLPVDECLICARDLRNKFVELLKEYKNEDGQTPTLSVGIAIGHFMENLEDLLDYGRAAERAAKTVEGKDALAVHLHKRGGSPIEVRGTWNEGLDKRFIKFARLMNTGIIPMKLAYELRSMADLYESWGENADSAIQQDLYRLIAKKTSRGENVIREKLSQELQNMDANKLLALAKQLLVARQIATAFNQAGGEKK